MVTAFDVPAAHLIYEVKEDLKGKIEAPAWSSSVKTGCQAQRPPAQKDWYYSRAASLLRRLYTQGPVGTERLRTVYGGSKSRGVRRSKHQKSGGKIIRLLLQQLEKLEFVSKTPRGRVLTSKGVSYIDHLAHKASLKG